MDEKFSQAMPVREKGEKRKSESVKRKVFTVSTRSSRWTLREKKALAGALQQYGFSDTSKLAAAVKTRDEAAVNYFIESLTSRVKYKLISEQPPQKDQVGDSSISTQQEGETSMSTNLQEVGSASCQRQSEVDSVSTQQKIDSISSEQLNGVVTVSAQQVGSADAEPTSSTGNTKGWSNLKCWRKLAVKQMMPRNRNRDYSSVVCKLLQAFHDEEEDLDLPNVPNVKALYKFVLDCSSSSIPAAMKPIDSAMILLLMRHLRNIANTYDLTEEVEFLQNFNGVTQFVPFDEENANAQSSAPSNSNCVQVPPKLYEDLSRHRKLKDNVNPLGIPLWLLAKEQEILEAYFKDKLK